MNLKNTISNKSCFLINNKSNLSVTVHFCAKNKIIYQV